MKRLITLITVISAFVSCQKEAAENGNPGFIKALVCDSDMVVVNNILLSDNSVIVVCRSLNESIPGYLYKLDASGKLIWTKRVSEKNSVLWQAYDLPGNGFATIGFGDGIAMAFEICLYDDDGNLQSSKQIPVFMNSQWDYMGGFSPLQMLKLSNGNYVFAGNYNADLFVCITDNSFDTLVEKKHVPSLVDNGCFVRGVCEQPAGTLIMSSSFGNLSPDYLHFEMDPYVYITDLQANLISQNNIAADSLHNETPGALVPIGGNFLMITGRMGGNHDGSGTYVNYLNNYWGSLCAGEINLVKLTADGQFISRQGIHDYPASGVILNARATSDGGYILCGTVNQAAVQNIVSPTKIYIMKVDATGGFQWSRIFNTAYPSIGVDAVETSDGGYLITGYEKALNKKYNAIVIKTGANGKV